MFSPKQSIGTTKIQLGVDLINLMRRILALVCSCLAFLEFHLWADGHKRNQVFRRWYLWLMRVKHGRQIYCGPRVFVRLPGNLAVGERCALGYDTRIWNYAPISIGDDFMAAAGLTINAGGHDIQTMRGTVAPIKIGHRVWCGLNVSILAGVTIGDDVVIAAGAVVTRDVPSGTLIGGVPARVLKNLDRDVSKFYRGDW